MRILHINTWDAGGAANAAMRIFSAQKARNFDVEFLCLSLTETEDEGHIESFEKYLQKKYDPLLTKVLLLLNRMYNQLPLGFDKSLFFNRPTSLYRVHLHPAVQEADIIHLHSVVKFIDYPTFFKAVKKPIVWTLHDMNPFKGGMHYESMMNDELDSLEEKYLQVKSNAIRDKQVHVVSPSPWLMKLSQSSRLFSNFTHYNIPYCIDTSRFRPESSPPPSPKGKKLLFVAQNVGDKRKGFRYLLEALSHLSGDIHLMVLGGISNEINVPPHITVDYLGYVSSPQRLAQIYAEASVYVISSVEDNLPNTVIESHIMGTPVVGFRTSGVADMIDHDTNGILVDEISGKHLAIGINKAFNMLEKNPDISSQISRQSREKYSEDSVVKSYSTVYDTVLSQMEQKSLKG